MTPRTLRQLLTEAPITESAALLLGATLHTPHGPVILIELEAYGGQEDPGSHAYRGETPRNRVMYGPAGHLYVYRCYGVHLMFNITARLVGEPGAILVRAALSSSGTLRCPMNGPGLFSRATGLTLADYGQDLLEKGARFQLEGPDPTHPPLVDRRIGLAPGKGDDKEWRFISAIHAEQASGPRSRLERARDRLHRAACRPGEDIRNPRDPKP